MAGMRDDLIRGLGEDGCRLGTYHPCDMVCQSRLESVAFKTNLPKYESWGAIDCETGDWLAWANFKDLKYCISVKSLEI